MANFGQTLLAGALGGLLALVGVVVTARLRANADAAADKRRADADQARWVREQRRGAYDHLLVALQREKQIIQGTLPMLGNRNPPPPALTDEEAALMEARFALHASKAVRDLFANWMRLRGQFFTAANEVAAAQAGVASGGKPPDRGKVEDARAALIGDTPGGGFLGIIEAQMRREVNLDT